MRICLFVSVILFLFGCNKDNSTIADCEKWELNKPILYNVEHSEIKSNKDSIILATKNIYRVELVVNKIGNSNKITWSIKYETRKPDSLLTDVERLLSDTIEYKEEYKIIYQTNKIGQYEKIINWSELKKYIDKLWVDHKRTLNINSYAQEEAIKNIEAAFLNRSALESKLTLVISPFHFIYGIPYSIKPTQTTEIMTGLNNEPLPSIMTKKVLTEENEFILMQITNEYDSDQVQTQVNQVLKTLKNKEMSTHIKMTDTCNIGFDKQTGWPYQIELWRISKSGNMQKQINISIKKIDS